MNTDLTNMRFGELVVLSIGIPRKNKTFWKVRCGCGKEYDVIGTTLKSGRSTRCKQCAYKKSQLNGELSASHFLHIKRRAKLSDIKFALTRKYLQHLYEQQNKKCAITGIDITFSNNTKERDNGGDTASLDRINSKVGYLPSNVQWIHKDINKMKGSMLDIELKEWCTKIVLFQEKLCTKST